MIKIKRTSESEEIKVKALVAGEPGVGKSRFSSTAPNPLILSAEGGLLSIADRDVPFVEYENEEGLRDLIKAMQLPPEERAEALGIEVDTFIIDTIDEVARLLMKEKLAYEKKKTPTIAEWGWLKEIMTSLTRAVRNLDMHVLLTAHLKSISTADGEEMMYRPAVDGSFGEQLPGYVDLALVMKSDVDVVIEDNETKRVIRRWLQTYPEPAYPWIKDRSGKLPNEVPVEFAGDFSRIVKLINTKNEEA